MPFNSDEGYGHIQEEEQGMEAPSMDPMGEAPDKTVSFDVEKNPQDMQFMSDSMMYAPMLKGMSKEERKEKWPEISMKLGQVSPKAKGMLDPSLPPTDEDLDALINKMPGAAEKQEGPIDFASMNNEEFANAAMLNAQEDTSDNLFGDDGDDESKLDKLKHHWLKKGKIYEIDEKTGKPFIRDIEDRSKKAISSDAAGKIAQIEASKAHFPAIKRRSFNEDGSINKANIAAMKASRLPLGAVSLGPIKYNQEGQALANSYEVVVQALTRSETGAAMPAEEVDNMRARIEPDITDSDETVLQKYLTMKMSVNGYLELSYRGKDGGKRYNDAHAGDRIGKMQAYVQNYRKEWVEKAMKHPKNKGFTAEQINQAFTKKILDAKPAFLKKIQKGMAGKSKYQE